MYLIADLWLLWSAEQIKASFGSVLFKTNKLLDPDGQEKNNQSRELSMIFLFLNCPNIQCNILLLQIKIKYENTKKCTKYKLLLKNTEKLEIHEIQNWVSGTCHPSDSSLPRAFYFHGKPSKPPCQGNVTANLSMTW